jgi:hypothetical protein
MGRSPFIGTNFPIRTPRDPGEEAFQRLWGPWALVTPADAALLLEGFGRPWWIAGGWAIDAFTGSEREHDDIDVSIFRADIEALRASAGAHLHIWSAGPEGLRPVDDRFPEVSQSADQGPRGPRANDAVAGRVAPHDVAHLSARTPSGP